VGLQNRHAYIASDLFVLIIGLKPDGTRCPLKYCYPTLQRVYKQDAQQIVKAGRNILGVSAEHHVGPEVASYLWKCPKCKGACQCSACRKKAGLEPLGVSFATKKSAGNGVDVASTSKRLADDEIDGPRKSKKPTTAFEVVIPEMNGDHNVVTSEINGDHKAKSKDEAAEAFMTPPPEERSMKAPEPSVSNFFKQPKPQIGPDEAGPSTSTLQPSTTIPLPALLPFQPKPKASMQQQVFQKPIRKPKMVERPQLSRIDTRLPVPNIVERIWLYESLIRFDWFKIPKTILNQLDRFDNWTESQTQTILERLICSIADISTIKTTTVRNAHKRMVEDFRLTGDDLDRGEAWEAAREYCLTKDVHMVDLENVELLPHQKGRDRKTRENKWRRNETLQNGRQTRSRRLAETEALARVKKISMEELESSEESEFDDDSTVETSVEESSEDEAPKGPRRSRRGLRKSARQQKARVVKRASISDSEDDADVVVVHQKIARDRSESVVEVMQEERLEPLPAPPFEQRIAILSSMVGVLMQSKQTNEEISFGFKQSLELEKAAKEEEKEIILKQEEEVRNHERIAPSMAMVEEYWQWKEDKNEMAKEHVLVLLDHRIHTHLQIELHKSRCEPLGEDSDGNVYWQLSEYVETMPEDTMGRWAWSLLVLGDTFGKEKDSERQSSTALQPIEMDSPRVSGNVTPIVSKDDKGSTSDDEVEMTFAESEKAIKNDCKTSEVPASSMDKSQSKYFCGTNDQETIAKLAEYIRHRLLMHEFEEQVDYRQKKQAEGEAKAREAQISLSDVAAMPSNGNMLLGERRINSEKTELKEKQKERRYKVEALLKKFDTVKDYYKWHEYDDES
jgi:hypothetical protein